MVRSAFVRLTRPSGEHIWVNLDCVVIIGHHKSGSILHTTSDWVESVTETPDQIWDMLRGAATGATYAQH